MSKGMGSICICNIFYTVSKDDVIYLGILIYIMILVNFRNNFVKIVKQHVTYMIEDFTLLMSIMIKRDYVSEDKRLIG